MEQLIIKLILVVAGAYISVCSLLCFRSKEQAKRRVFILASNALIALALTIYVLCSNEEHHHWALWILAATGVVSFLYMPDRTVKWRVLNESASLILCGLTCYLLFEGDWATLSALQAPNGTEAAPAYDTNRGYIVGGLLLCFFSAGFLFPIVKNKFKKS